jgi:transcriptional regulator with XRE-family HTH domain
MARRSVSSKLMKWRQKIAKHRAAQHLSQADLGNKIGVRQSQIWQWEAGRNPRSEPKLSQAAKLARELKISLDYLTDDSLSELPAPAASPEEMSLLKFIRAAKLNHDDIWRILTELVRSQPETDLNKHLNVVNKIPPKRKPERDSG